MKYLIIALVFISFAAIFSIFYFSLQSEVIHLKEIGMYTQEYAYSVSVLKRELLIGFIIFAVVIPILLLIGLPKDF